MANLCEYDLKAVAKDKDSLDRFIKILSGKDPERYLYKTYSAIVHSSPKKNGILWETVVIGDMGWDVGNWLNAPFPDDNFKTDEGKKLSSMQELCHDLGVAVEVWGREPNMAFQRYILLDFLGNVSSNETKDWNPMSEESDDPEDENGFADYGEFSDAKKIFVGTV